MYKSNSENAFQLEHFWRILRNEAKWLNVRDNVKVHTRQPATQFCHTIASSINLDEDCNGPRKSASHICAIPQKD